MSSKNTTILITLIILLGLSAAGFLIYKNLIKPAAEAEREGTLTVPLVGEEGGIENPPIGGEETPGIKGEETLEETTLVEDDFTIIMPPGWRKIPDVPGVLAMAADAQEEITNLQAKNIGFRTNFSVKSDDMTQYDQIQGMEDYIDSIESSLVELIPSIKFTTAEREGTINNRRAIFIECESRQEDIDFQTLLVFIEGNDQTIWAISFNTLRDSWSTYRDLFYQIAQSFKLKL